jgi:hypothetical protein
MTRRNLIAAAALSVLLSAVFTGPVVAAAPAPSQPAGVTLTVYSSADPAGFDPQQWVYVQSTGYNPYYADPSNVPGFGVIKEVRIVNLQQGQNTLDFSDVAAFIDPTTVSFQDLTVPDAAVLQQQFKFDLVSPEKLLQKYLGQNISVTVPRGAASVQIVTGNLLSAQDGGLVLQTPSGIQIINGSYNQVQLGALPSGLMIKPTLEWLVTSPRSGKQQILTAYETKGLTWIADYNLVLGADDKTASLAAWVTLLNLSGKTYENAQLKLIAGEVNRVQPPQPMYMTMQAAALAENGVPPTFQEKKFFEYHMYTLPRLVTIPQNSTQQIALFPTRSSLEVQKVLVFSGQDLDPWWSYSDQPDLNPGSGITTSSGEAGVYVRFMNNKDNSLGIPLPAGKIRLYQQDPVDGTLEFIGEDLIQNTPRDELVSVKVGNAFDITGRRVQTDFHVDSSANQATETYSITLSNHTDAVVHVEVPQYLWRWSNWQIQSNSDSYQKLDSRTIEFSVDVPANGKKEITYTVQYSW